MSYTIEDLVNIYPFLRHERTSCKEGLLMGNEYPNEAGHPRCSKCALRHMLINGKWPYGMSAEHIDLSFTVVLKEKG